MIGLDLAGRRVVVCGGSRGIGRSIALGFAEAGADVSICARGAETLEKTRTELAAKGRKAHAAPCDLSDHAAIQRYIAGAAEALGGIDVLVNNASGFGIGDDEKAWEAGINVDLLGLVRASRAAQPMLEKSRGSIVNISSIAGLKPSTRTSSYAAVKAAVINYTSSQAAMLAPKGVRVNCIAPGSIEFPGGTWEKRKTENPALYRSVFDKIAWGRLGTPEEIANVAVFLASPLASWVTGQTIAVDGGQMLS